VSSAISASGDPADAFPEAVDGPAEEHDGPDEGCGNQNLADRRQPITGCDPAATSGPRNPPGDQLHDGRNGVGESLGHSKSNHWCTEHTDEKRGQKWVEHLRASVLRQAHRA
jgi:hypothetical protein